MTDATDATPDRVAVIGGGAVGTTLAGDLGTRGVAVTLFERETVAAGSTGRAAGICYDAFADRRDVALAGRALERFRALDVDFTACPYVLLARTGDPQADDIRDLVARMAERGVDVDLLDPSDLAARFPGLRTADVAVAAIAYDAGVLDPERYATTMATRARRAGVDVRTDEPARLVEPTTVVAGGRSHDFDAVVVAAGTATAPLVAAVGVDLALGYYRAQALLTDAFDRALPSLYDATGEYYLRPREGGVLLGDGVEVDVDPTDADLTADATFRESILAHAETALTDVPAVERAWAGLCTATPDGDPLVGAVAPGLYVATGWHGHGLMWAPAVAERLADQVLGGDGIRGFEPTRFDGDEPITIGVGLEE